MPAVPVPRLETAIVARLDSVLPIAIDPAGASVGSGDDLRIA
jgi:hypothetical protein